MVLSSNQSAFQTAAGAAVSFSAPAQALYIKSLETVDTPRSWKPADHRYENTVRDRMMPHHQWRRRVLQSEDGAWGIGLKRSRRMTISDLVISRMGALAGLPIAPVFLNSTLQQGEYREVVSVVPFNGLVLGGHLPLKNMPAFHRHYSRMLPFLLWVGPDTDRHSFNLCMNTYNKASFADFDFDKGTLTMFMGARPSGAKTITDIVENKFSHPTDLRIDRDAFNEGLALLDNISPEGVCAVLDMVDEAVGFRGQEKQTMLNYLGRQSDELYKALEDGVFEPYITENLGATPKLRVPKTRRFDFK